MYNLPRWRAIHTWTYEFYYLFFNYFIVTHQNRICYFTKTIFLISMKKISICICWKQNIFILQYELYFLFSRKFKSSLRLYFGHICSIRTHVSITRLTMSQMNEMHHMFYFKTKEKVFINQKLNMMQKYLILVFSICCFWY